MDAYYLVFTGRKWENVMGKKGITWEIGGIFQAPSEHDACLVAAQRTGAGTCFAVPGYAWGVDTMQAQSVTEFGAEPDPASRLEQFGRRLEERFAAVLERGTVPELERGDESGE